MRRHTEQQAGWQRAVIAAGIYAQAVIDVLAAEFPDLRNAETASIVRGHIYAHAREPGPMEVIIDNPASANWRLTTDRDQPGRVRLACWKQNPLPPASQERLDRLNAALQAIGTEPER